MKTATGSLLITAALLVAACSSPLESVGDAAGGDGAPNGAPEARAGNGSSAGGADTSRAVACLGRIEPATRVRRLSAPFTMLGPPILGELRADIGDRVTAGTVVAVLASSPVLDAAAREADRAVEVARRRLAVVTSGEKSGTIAAQRSEVARLEAELHNAEIELDRRRKLHEDKVLSASELDAYALLRQQREALLAAGRELLEAVAEIRDVDVELARAELEQAIAAADRAHTDHDQTLVRSPIDGEVLAVNARAGEVIGPDGILDLGELATMIVVAEVYATDIGRVRAGAVAEITAEFLPQPLQGKVARIGRMIQPNATLDRDPSAFADRRVVEVEIAVDDGERLAGLVHGEVRVRIGPGGGP